MCDCPSDKNERERPETLTLFQKCPKPFKPGKDFVASSDDDIANLNDLTLKFPGSPSCLVDGVPCSSDTTNTESSSEISRIYKFVDPRGCECSGEDDEKASQLELCVEGEEEEEEIGEIPDIECTLAIIKPESMVYKEKIENRIYDEGFEVYQTRWLRLSPEQAAEFYADKYGELCFPRVVTYMSSAPIIVLVLAKQNAIYEWRRIIGPSKVADARLYYPDSIRSLYGRRGDDIKNAVHGSSNREEAEKEIHFFFPEFIIEPLLKNEMVVDYLAEIINPVLVNGLTMCCKCKPNDPLTFLGKWLILNNPNKPKLSEDLALVPT